MPGRLFYREVLDTSWFSQAACSKIDTKLAFKLFFPEEETPHGRERQPSSLQSMVGGNITEQAREAVRICRTCPVVEECRAYAVKNSYATGIWGGTTRADRNRIRKNRGGRQGVFVDRTKKQNPRAAPVNKEPSPALSFIQTQVQPKETDNG